MQGRKNPPKQTARYKIDKFLLQITIKIITIILSIEIALSRVQSISQTLSFSSSAKYCYPAIVDDHMGVGKVLRLRQNGLAMGNA